MLQWSTTKYMLISKLTKLQLTSLPQACCRPFERSTTWGDFSRIWVHNWLSATLREDRVWANFVTFRQGSWRKKKKQFFYYLSNRNYTTTALQTDTFHQSMICTSITETLHFAGLRLSDWTPKFLHNVPSMRLHGYFSWVKHYSPHSEWLFSEARK